MKYIQALKEQGYNLKTLPTDIKKAINLVLKSKDYNSKVEALDFITFNSIRNSQPVDERIEELHKLSLTDHSVEDNNGFNTALSIEIAEEEFASGGHIATKDDNNKVRNWKVRFHLARGENFMNWKVENPKTKEIYFYKPDEVQIEMFNCKLTNSPTTALKIFTGKMDKSPIAWVVCENYKVSKKIDPVDADERLTYNPRTAPNWFDTDGDNVDNYVFEKLVTFGRGVYYETPDGKLFALGGIADQEEMEFKGGGSIPTHDHILYDVLTEKLDAKLYAQASKYFSEKVTDDYWHFSVKYFNGSEITYEVYSVKGGFWVNFEVKNDSLLLRTMRKEPIAKFTYGGNVSSSRLMIPNVRGGWTKEKIIRYFKDRSSDTIGTPTLAKYISEFDNWQQFKEHIYYHGTTNYIEKGLKPSMAFSERWAEQQGGGGYGDRYFGISLTKRKRTAEIFAGQSSGVTIYPVILKRDAKVIERTDFQDASDVEDIIVELYEQGIDAVWIGGGEEELVAVNPFAILLYNKGKEYHSAFGGFKSVPLTDEKIKEIYNNSLQIWQDYSEAKSKANTKEERNELLNSIPRIQFETGGSTEQMARGKKIDIPVVFKQTIGDFKIYIEEVKSKSGEVFYSGEVYLKDMILRIFPAVSSDIEELKKIMRNYIDQIKISANANTPDTIFIDGKSMKVSKEIYNYVLSKSSKKDAQKYTYALTIRPFDIGTYPKENFVRFVEEEEDNYKFGLLEYSAPIDDREISHYSLAPVSELLPYDEIVFDYYEGNLGQAFIERTKGNIPYVKVFLYDDPNEDYIEKKDLTGQEFLRNIKNGNYKIIDPQPRLKDTDGENHLSKPTPQPTPEPIVQPTPEIKKEEPKMENNQPTGSVSNWNEVPVRWKNVKAVRPMTFNLNPYDKGLNSIVKEFLGDDALRPVMTAMNFGDSGVVSTDAHKLLHIHYKHSDFRGNYATANTLKALKSSRWKDTPKDLAEANEQIKDDKYPNWIAVIPKDNPYVYEVDIMKLYQYLNVAINYANKTTHQVAFRYDKGRAIGFNGKFLMQSLEAMMKIQKCTKVYLHLSEPSRAMLVTYEKSISPTGNTYVLTMPVMVNRGAERGDLDERGRELKITQIFGTSDIDNNKYLNCYFDFEDSQIHNGDGSIADYKESYGDAEEMPLALITMLDKFIKISKPRLPILENVCVDGNGIRVDNLEARIEIANDWKIPQGLYRIEKNAMVQNTLNGNLDDFPKLNSRVPTNNPVFTIDTEVFKYYVLKASEHIGDDDLRPMMKSILFQYDQGGYLQIVSTSGYTLFHANVTKYASQIRNKNFTFPVANVKELINFTKNIDSKEIKFYVNENDKYRIDGGRLHFEAKISDGKFPNWEAVTPIKYSNQLSFDIKDLFVCMNNEVAKTFAKSEDLKPNVTTIFNQDDKIFIGNFPKSSDEQVTSKEICNIKIKKETFSTDQSFNTSSSNYVLLMPQMRTNGNYFNFAVDHLNDTITTIGKERVIVNYTDLSRAYIFTSDNLDYKTSDVYKPEKAVTTPVKNKMTSQQGKMKKHTEMVQKVQAEQKSASTNYKTDKYGRLEPNATQLKMQKTPVPEMDQKMKNQIELLEKEYNLKYDKKLMSDWGMRYIELRRKIYPDWQDVDKYFGKKIGSFKVGDVIGSLARNTDTDREVVLERTNGKVYVIPYNYAYPKIREYDLSAGGWELIEPKQNLLVVDPTKKQPATPPEPKNSGKNPSEFNVGDIIESSGVTYEVKTPKTKDNFSLLINLSDKYRKGDIDEFANTEHTKKFKLVSKKSPVPVKSKPKDDTQELQKAIKGLEAFLFSFGATKTKANLEESLAVQSAIKGLKALLK